MAINAGDILTYNGSTWVNQPWVQGSFGIGTAPSYPLHVAGLNSTQFFFNQESGIAFAGLVALSGQQWSLRNNTSSVRLDIRDDTAAAVRISIDGSGRVGVGTTSPTAALHLKAGTASANTAPQKFTSGTNLSTTEAGAVEFDGARWFATPVTTRRAVALSSDHITATTTVVNTLTETTVFTGTIAANEMATGKTFRARILGRYSTQNATPTVTIRAKVAGVVVSTIVSTAASVTDAPFDIELILTVRSTGVSGTYWTFTAGFINSIRKDVDNTSVGGVNTTAAANITFTAQWSAANASNSFSVDQAYLEMLN